MDKVTREKGKTKGHDTQLFSEKLPWERKEVRDVTGSGLLIYFERGANRIRRQLEIGGKQK